MKKKFRLVTTCAWAWAGAEKYHEIEGEYETEDKALEAFGGAEEAYQQAVEDHCPDYHVEEVE